MEIKVAIIGAGPNGIWASKLLIEKGYEVTLFEAGSKNLVTSELSNANYTFATPSAVPNLSHSLGGGSNLWLGRIGEFREADFLSIDGVRKSDWPFEIGDLAEHYLATSKFLTNRSLSDFDVLKILELGLGDTLCDELMLRTYRFINLDSFNECMNALQQNPLFTLKLNSLCVDLKESDEGKVTVHVKSDGKEYDHQFDRVVVCGGALQSTALMLRSKELLGFKAASLIGVGLMEHMDGYVGNIVAKRNKDGRKLSRLALRSDRTTPLQESYRAGFGITLSDKFLEEKKLLNFHIEIVPYQSRYRFENYVHPTHKFSQNAIISTLMKLGLLVEKVVKKSVFLASSPILRLLDLEIYSLWLKGEEIPHMESRVFLDPLSKEKIVYRHQVSKETVANLQQGLREIKRIFAENEIGRIHLYRYMMKKSGKVYLRPNWHPMGTLRIAESNGVVNRNFLFGNTKSIYVGDSSIFNTGSNANPTFTAMALVHKLVTENF